MQKKASYSFVAALLLASSLALAQSNPQQPVNQQFASVSWGLQNPPLPVPDGSVRLVGNPGPASFSFWIVANYTIGNSQPAGPFTLSNAPNSFSASNYAVVSWTSSPGALTYDVLMTTGAFPPSGACGCAVATAQSDTTLNVTSNSLSAYIVISVDANKFAIVSQNVQQAAGVSKLLFTLPDGTFMGSLDTTGQLVVNSCIGCGGGGGGLNPGTAYQEVNYGPTGGTTGYPDNYVTSSPSLFLSTASGGIQSYGGFTSGGGTPVLSGVLNLAFASGGVLGGNFGLSTSPSFTAPGYSWWVPNGDAAGCVQSPGGGTPSSPSQLFIGPCGAPGGSLGDLQYNNAGAFGGTNGDFTFGSHTITGGSSAIFDLSGAALFKIPVQSGATAGAADGQMVYDSLHGNIHATNYGTTDSIVAVFPTDGSFTNLDCVHIGYSHHNIELNDAGHPCGGTTATTPNVLKGDNAGNALASSIVDDGTNPTQAPNGIDTSMNGLSRSIPNGAAGTTLNYSVCRDASGNAQSCGTAITAGMEGTATIGVGTAPGTSGLVSVCDSVSCTAVFDNQTVIGHWAIPSTTVTGQLHDNGLTTQSAGIQSWYITSLNSGAGTTAIVDILSGNVVSGGSGGGGPSTKVQVNGTGTNAIGNFNNTTPPAQTDFLNLTWQASNSGVTTSISAEVPYATSSTPGVVQPDNTTITITGGVISSAGSGLSNVVMPADWFSSSITGGVETVTKNNQGSSTFFRTLPPSTQQPFVIGGTSTQCSWNAGSSTNTCTLNQASNTGNHSLVVDAFSGDSLVSVTDNKGSTYNARGCDGNYTHQCVYVADNIVAGITTLTITTAASLHDGGALAVELGNMATSSFDVANAGDFSSCNPPAYLAPVTTVNANDIIISTAATPAGMTYVAGVGWSLVGSTMSGGATSSTGLQVATVSIAGPYTPTISCSGHSQQSVTVALKGASSPPSLQPGSYPLFTADFQSFGLAPLYDINGTLQNSNPHGIIGSCTMGTNCSITLTGQSIFSDTTYSCWTSPVTGTVVTGFSKSSGSAFAFTGTGTGTVSFGCQGN